MKRMRSVLSHSEIGDVRHALVASPLAVVTRGKASNRRAWSVVFHPQRR